MWAKSRRFVMSILTVEIPNVVKLTMQDRYSKRHPPSKITAVFDIVSLESSLEAAIDLGNGNVELSLDNGKAINAFHGTPGLSDSTIATPSSGSDPLWLLFAYEAVAAVADQTKTRDVIMNEGQLIEIDSNLDTPQPKLGQTLRQLGTLMGKTPTKSGITWRFSGVSISNRKKLIDLIRPLITSASGFDQLLLTNTARNALGIQAMK
jgi:hypothetical protein